MKIIKTESYKQSSTSDLNTQPGNSGSSGPAHQMFPSGDSNSEQSVVKNWNKKKKKKKKIGTFPKDSQ